jgi:DNA-binding NarL/FixJ family response regulator
VSVVADDEASLGLRTVRVLVVDVLEIVYWGLRLHLTAQSWVERCLYAPDRRSAIAQVSRYDPQIVLIDPQIGAHTGLELCRELVAMRSSVKVLLFGGGSDIAARQARAAGAFGSLNKSWPPGRVVEAVADAARGRQRFVRQHEVGTFALNHRESQVLHLIAAGLTNKEIADAMKLSPHTVKDYTSSLYRTLNVRNRPEAVQRAQLLGWLPTLPSAPAGQHAPRVRLLFPGARRWDDHRIARQAGRSRTS